MYPFLTNLGYPISIVFIESRYIPYGIITPIKGFCRAQDTGRTQKTVGRGDIRYFKLLIHHMPCKTGMNSLILIYNY